MFISQKLTNGTIQARRIFILIVLNLFFLCSIFAQSGSGIDLTFNAVVSSNVSYTSSGYGLANSKADIAIQPDGKILIFGNFSNVREKAINKIARLNADGTLDNS